VNLIFAGTPAFAAVALESLVAAGHDVRCVLTQPDRPAGRRLQAQASAVKQLAERLGLRMLQPATLKDPGVLAELRAMAPEILVVAAYGLILPQMALDIPARGALNIHASLLPRWRGAAPIQRALLAGDVETGICIMRMDAGLDTGPVLLHEAIPIRDDDDAGTLHDKLAALGARLIVVALDRLQRGELPAIPQPDDGVTYARKIDKTEARLNWNEPAQLLSRRVRAFCPVPGASSDMAGMEIKIWRAKAMPSGTREGNSGYRPGEVVSIADGCVRVACGDGMLELLELQRPGGKRLYAAEFLRGFPLSPGMHFRG
jgi:methionyl-tRNA formyltransferase